MTELLLFLAGAFLGLVTGWLICRKWNAKAEAEYRKRLAQLEEITGL